jgi:hypothetical protein
VGDLNSTQALVILSKLAAGERPEGSAVAFAFAFRKASSSSIAGCPILTALFAVRVGNLNSTQDLGILSKLAAGERPKGSAVAFAFAFRKASSSSIAGCPILTALFAVGVGNLNSTQDLGILSKLAAGERPKGSAVAFAFASREASSSSIAGCPILTALFAVRVGNLNSTQDLGILSKLAAGERPKGSAVAFAFASREAPSRAIGRRPQSPFATLHLQ